MSDSYFFYRDALLPIPESIVLTGEAHEARARAGGDAGAAAASGCSVANPPPTPNTPTPFTPPPGSLCSVLAGWRLKQRWSSGDERQPEDGAARKGPTRLSGLRRSASWQRTVVSSPPPKRGSSRRFARAPCHGLQNGDPSEASWSRMRWTTLVLSSSLHRPTAAAALTRRPRQSLRRGQARAALSESVSWMSHLHPRQKRRGARPRWHRLFQV